MELYLHSTNTSSWHGAELAQGELHLSFAISYKVHALKIPIREWSRQFQRLLQGGRCGLFDVTSFCLKRLGKMMNKQWIFCPAVKT
jgi:hypothetical protein